jgi:senataxin
MHKTISKFISDTFYEGNLLDAEDIVDKTVNEPCLKHPAFQPFTYYDIESEEGFDKNSFFNEEQILLIIELYKQLKEIYSIQQISERLAIISPYSNQVYRIKECLKMYEGRDTCPVEVNTVDGFQGKEKNIIIFSTVRSIGSKSVGFLSDERRMNVGLSRAKSCLIVIGDSKKLITDKNWEKLVKYSFRNGTFYKVKGRVKGFWEKFMINHSKYLVRTDEDFVRNVYSQK